MTAEWDEPQWQDEAPFVIAGQYGKTRVRVAKIFRRSEQIQDFVEFSVECLLEGDMYDSYTRGTNQNIVPTDTVKNTVIMLAGQLKEVPSPERFGIIIAQHLLEKHRHLTKISVGVEEPQWQRITEAGELHNHAFQLGSYTRTAKVLAWDGGKKYTVMGGVKGLKLLKTTMSGFEGYIKDNFTSLVPVKDRVFATEVTGFWRYRGYPAGFPDATLEIDHRSVSRRVIERLVSEFSGPSTVGKYSGSVQKTMHEMATAVLESESTTLIGIQLELPNLHYVQFNSDQFGYKNDGTLLVPLSDPSGLIKLQVVSKDFNIKQSVTRMLIE